MARLYIETNTNHDRNLNITTYRAGASFTNMI